MSQQERIKVVTPPCRISYPALYETAKYEGKDTGRYQCDLIFAAGTNVDDLVNAVQQAIAQQWGSNPPPGIYNPFKVPNAQKAQKKGYEEPGCFFITPKSPRKVPVCLNRKVQNPTTGRLEYEQAGPESNEFYAGCIVVASLTVYPFTKGNGGVNFGLQSILKVADAEPFGAQSDPEADFGDIPVEDAVAHTQATFLQQGGGAPSPFGAPAPTAANPGFPPPGHAPAPSTVPANVPVPGAAPPAAMPMQPPAAAPPVAASPGAIPGAMPMQPQPVGAPAPMPMQPPAAAPMGMPGMPGMPLPESQPLPAGAPLQVPDPAMPQMPAMPSMPAGTSYPQ